MYAEYGNIFGKLRDVTSTTTHNDRGFLVTWAILFILTIGWLIRHWGSIQNETAVLKNVLDILESDITAVSLTDTLFL